MRPIRLELRTALCLLALAQAVLLLCAPLALAQPLEHRLPPDARAALVTFLRTLFPELASQHSACATYYVTQATGDDARPCDQARCKHAKALPQRGVCLPGAWRYASGWPGHLRRTPPGPGQREPRLWQQ